MKPTDSKRGEARICPEEWTLDAYQRRELDDAATGELRSHLAHCQVCQRLVDEFAAGEKLGAVLREAEQDTDPVVRQRVLDSATKLLRTHLTNSHPREAP